MFTRQTLALTNEFEFMVAAIRHAFVDSEQLRLRQLASLVDWEKVEQLSRRHRVSGLVGSVTASMTIPLPGDITERWRDASYAIAEQNLRNAVESANLLAAFQSAGVDLLFVKGLTLGKLAYGNPHLKMDADIDILVSPDAIAQAAAILGKLGFQSLLPSTVETINEWHRRKKESVWRKGGTQLDLHGRLANNPGMIPNIGMQSPRQDVDVGGGNILPTLADEPLFSYLCVHGASSAWFRLKWIADLSAFLSRDSRLTMLERYDDNREWRANRAVAQALILAHQLFQIPLDDGLGQAIGGVAERRLAGIALAQLLNPIEPTERTLGTASIHLSQFMLKRGLRYKWSELATQLRS